MLKYLWEYIIDIDWDLVVMVLCAISLIISILSLFISAYNLDRMAK
jgi:hypothetical protein